MGNCGKEVKYTSCCHFNKGIIYSWIIKSIVRIRVREITQNLGEEDAQAHNTESYYLVCKYKDK